MKNHLSTASIDNDLIAGARALVKVTQSDDSGQSKTSRDDCHVRRPATGVGRDCFDVIQIEFGDRRRQ